MRDEYATKECYTATGELTHDFYLHLLSEANKIRSLIYNLGGMATKSAVEDALMIDYVGLNRGHVHTVMNTLEFHSAPILLDVTEPDEYPQLREVDVRWYRGNPYNA